MLDFLLRDKAEWEAENFFDRKLLFLKDEWGHVVTDDLAILRVVF